MVGTTHLLFLSTKLLAGVWACSAFDSSAGQLKDSNNVSHAPHYTPQVLSAGKNVAHAPRSTLIDDRAENGKIALVDSKEEARVLPESGFEGLLPIIFKKLSVPSEITHLPEIAPVRYAGKTEEDSLTELVNVAKALLEKKKVDSHLLDLTFVLQKYESTKDVADLTLISLLQDTETAAKVIDAWLKAGKTPEDVLRFLLQYVHGKSLNDFIKSDLFSTWLSYVYRTDLSGVVKDEDLEKFLEIVLKFEEVDIPEFVQLVRHEIDKFSKHVSAVSTLRKTRDA